MKVLSRLVNEKYAMPFAGFMEWICRLIMLYMALCLVLSVMGRQTFTLLMNGKEYKNAYCAQDSPRSGSRMWTVHSDDDITDICAGAGAGYCVILVSWQGFPQCQPRRYFYGKECRGASLLRADSDIHRFVCTVFKDHRAEGGKPYP